MTAPSSLEIRYRTLFGSKPEWAWPFPPSCPLVGRDFLSGESLLVYASAENFSWMNRSEVPARFLDERAWSRYRAVYEECGKGSEAFFPDVGIQPFTDGGLFCAALFVSEKLGLPTAAAPRELIEHIAFTNWGKFTIKTDKQNVDYVSDDEKLVESVAYIVAEISELRPKVALVPKTIWQKRLFSEPMRGASPHTRFLPIPQFNATVVNTHLTNYQCKALTMQQSQAGTSLGEWMRHLHGFREENAWRYLAMLDELLVENQ